MAVQVADRLKIVGKDRVVIAGSFRPAGTGAITNVEGHGFSAARQGVGDILVTLDKAMPQLISYSCGWRHASKTDSQVFFGDYVAGGGTTSGTIEIVTMESGSVADWAADADSEVAFTLIFRNNSGSY